MAGKGREPIDIEANVRHLVDWLGPEPFLAGLSLEERLVGLSPEDRRRLRELLLEDEEAAPRSQKQGRSGAARRASGKRRGSG